MDFVGCVKFCHKEFFSIETPPILSDFFEGTATRHRSAGRQMDDVDTTTLYSNLVGGGWILLLL